MSLKIFLYLSKQCRLWWNHFVWVLTVCQRAVYRYPEWKEIRRTRVELLSNSSGKELLLFFMVDTTYKCTYIAWVGLCKLRMRGSRKFCRVGGSNSDNFLFSLWGKRGSKYHKKADYHRLASETPLNGFLLEGRWWANIKCWLGSFEIFQGIRISTALKPYILWIFRWWVSGPPVPALDPPISRKVKLWVNDTYLAPSPSSQELLGDTSGESVVGETSPKFCNKQKKINEQYSYIWIELSSTSKFC